MTVVASRFERKYNDLYETPAWVTHALLRVLPINLKGLKVWEPAAGRHAISGVIKDYGAEIFTSDIEVYDQGHNALFDFLGDGLPYCPAYCDAIITNPPYGRGNRDAVKLAEKALERCNGWVALLLTAKFDSGKTRTSLFRDNPRFLSKVVLLDRIQWFEGEHGGTEDHAWYIWAPTSNSNIHSAHLLYEGKVA